MVTHAFPLSRLAPHVKDLEPSALGRLSWVHVPTLVVVGEKDVREIQTNGKLLQKQVVGTELVSLSDVGHMLVMENHRSLIRLLIIFCVDNALLWRLCVLIFL
jgi:pimeloyl-ACP methyl ester carboxylesterase